jgi:hypothetical protein
MIAKAEQLGHFTNNTNLTECAISEIYPKAEHFPAIFA